MRCKPCSINHSPLGLIFRILSSLQSIINLSLESMDYRLKTTLIMHGLGVNDLHLINSSTGIRQFSIKSTLAAFSRVKKSSRFLNFSTESTSFALSNANSLHDFLAPSSLFFKSSDGLPKLSLIPLDSFLSFSISLVGMIKGNLKFIDVRFKFLFDAPC